MYTTVGFSDSCCNHRHKDMKSAAQCLMNRRAENGYSDRTIRRVDSEGYIHLLAADESLEANRIVHQLRKESASC